MNIFQNTNDVIFGNDIVDLSDNDCSMDHINIRFIKKISTEKEINNIFNNSYEKNLSNYLNLWKLWSLKESAYKTVSRIYFIPTFYYKDYEVQNNFSTVNYKKFSLETQIFLAQDLLFTITYYTGKYLLEKKPIRNYVFFSFIKTQKNKTPNSDSKEIRKFVEGIFFQFLNKQVMVYRHYDIQYKVFMPPFLFIEKKFFPISLSHHGKFLVFTIAINEKNQRFFLNFFSNCNIKKLENHFIIFI
ncbi:MAG: 4'-phosphopantetheinyl transferase superfamily protein [Leptonema sp. (in: bacteria)]